MDEIEQIEHDLRSDKCRVCDGRGVRYLEPICRLDVDRCDACEGTGSFEHACKLLDEAWEARW